MRKKLIIAAAVILLLLLSFWGILEYRQYSSYKVPIHNSANAILKINFDALVKTFILENGFRSGSKKDTGQKEETITINNTGIYFPGNIFIYTIAGKKSTTLFCTLPMKDKQDFKRFAENKLGLTFSNDDEGSGKDGRLTFHCSSKHIFIAWSADKENVSTVLNDLANGNNILDRKNLLLKEVKKDRSHFVFSNAEISAIFNFKENTISTKLTLPVAKYVSIDNSVDKIKRNENAWASFYLAGKPASGIFSKSYTIKDINVETDSMLAYFDRYADVQVTGITEQADTVITYEYNDEFEKKEVKTIAKIKVPAMVMTLEANPSLLRYLQKQNIVTTSSTINKDVFPLYNVTAKQFNQQLILSTDSTAIKGNKEYEKGNNFMELHIDFQKLRPMIDSSFIGTYTKELKQINLKGYPPGKITADIRGTIELEKNVFESLEQIFTAANKK